MELSADSPLRHRLHVGQAVISLCIPAGGCQVMDLTQQSSSVTALCEKLSEYTHRTDRCLNLSDDIADVNYNSDNSSNDDVIDTTENSSSNQAVYGAETHVVLPAGNLGVTFKNTPSGLLVHRISSSSPVQNALRVGQMVDSLLLPSASYSVRCQVETMMNSDQLSARWFCETLRMYDQHTNRCLVMRNPIVPSAPTAFSHATTTRKVATGNITSSCLATEGNFGLVNVVTENVHTLQKQLLPELASSVDLLPHTYLQKIGSIQEQCNAMEANLQELHQKNKNRALEELERHHSYALEQLYTLCTRVKERIVSESECRFDQTKHKMSCAERSLQLYQNKYTDVQQEAKHNVPALQHLASMSERRPMKENSSTTNNSNRESIDQEEMRLPSALRCPITLVLMKDPVLAPDGNMYERDAIRKWLQTSKLSPLTGGTMNATTKPTVKCNGDDANTNFLHATNSTNNLDANTWPTVHAIKFLCDQFALSTSTTNKN